MKVQLKVEYAKTWYAKWPKGMQDTEGAGNLIQSQFQEGKLSLSSMDHGKHLL